MNKLSQYFTLNTYSKLLVNSIDVSAPNTVLDMGVGNGALTFAAIERWRDSKYIAIDIDSQKCDYIRQFSNSITIINGNALNPKLNKKLQLKIGTVDVAICNPPYGSLENNKSYKMLFKKAHLQSCISFKRIASDIVFFAHNLVMLKEGGQLGIILPDGILTRKDLKVLRSDILTNHAVKHIIQLPDKIFLGTEARTHILIITKGRSNNNLVKLSLVDRLGNNCNSIHVEKEQLIERMDYSFHCINSTLNKYEGVTLSNLGAKICRGNLTHKKLKELNVKYIHSTNINNNFLCNEIDDSHKIMKYACSGDILLVRVGKRCVGKIKLLESGDYLISDCIYRIRLPKENIYHVWNFLSSEMGKQSINMLIHGVCSQLISKEDLLNLNVPTNFLYPRR